MSDDKRPSGPTASQNPNQFGIVTLDDAECREILTQQRLCVIAMTDGDAPYAVPLFYGFDGERLWLGISDGRKTLLLDRNPRLSVVVTDVGPGNAWRSVVVTGTATWVTDLEERAKGIQVLMQHNRRGDRSPSPDDGTPKRR